LKKLLIIPLLLFSLAGLAQPRWKQNLRYDFHVVFDSAQKSLQAIMKLDYTNNSPDTLGFIWFQLWPNAYRNDRTLYTEQQLENGDLRDHRGACCSRRIGQVGDDVSQDAIPVGDDIGTRARGDHEQ